MEPDLEPPLFLGVCARERPSVDVSHKVGLFAGIVFSMASSASDCEKEAFIFAAFALSSLLSVNGLSVGIALSMASSASDCEKVAFPFAAFSLSSLLSVNGLSVGIALSIANSPGACETRFRSRVCLLAVVSCGLTPLSWPVVDRPAVSKEIVFSVAATRRVPAAFGRVQRSMIHCLSPGTEVPRQKRG